ncbi:DUF3306 domain-containing protein [Denitrobaculum tricleocarpae]|uniref:DUF3306 domain-containing protein n=1 Tax=Denitrobaculum tricleocarpae TaxID=2591009 RepID=UPI0015D1D06C|nr:DUF3306 domain-containing protein [Denitrobaculum tricleocarpae]
MAGDDKRRPGEGATSQEEGIEEGGFLRRWSRRKGAQAKTSAPKSAGASARQIDFAEPSEEAPLELPSEAPVRGRMITSPPGGVPTIAEQAAQQHAETTKPPQGGTADEEAAAEKTGGAEEELPDVEDLEADSDFTPFLKKGVSEQIQRRALRKLWLSDPVLANVDGLLDYGDDFTDAAMVIENMKTVYTVGRGMVPKPKDEDAEDAEVETDEAEPEGEAGQREAAEADDQEPEEESAEEPAGSQAEAEGAAQPLPAGSTDLRGPDETIGGTVGAPQDSSAKIKREES